MVLADIRKVFCKTTAGGHPLFQSYRQKTGVPFYTCADEQSVDWLIAPLHRF
jgi:hypothetical protein